MATTNQQGWTEKVAVSGSFRRYERLTCNKAGIGTLDGCGKNDGFSRGKSAILPSFEPGLLDTSHWFDIFYVG
jgi:hypothetical protein